MKIQCRRRSTHASTRAAGVSGEGAFETSLVIGGSGSSGMRCDSSIKYVRPRMEPARSGR